ncbi:MAG: hypothetical protein V4525_01725 [Pseudomonadota bacterium]
MDLKNTTKNQHFISQVEQRLNTINPNSDDENQKIYAFKLKKRESYLIELESKKGFKINNSLTLNDLFSFDVLNNEIRSNFEKLFHQYEYNIRSNTKILLDKIPLNNSEIKDEILNLFISKFINFVRNPYSIKKVIDSFPSLKNCYPTNPIHFKNFELIITGKKPQQKFLCESLGISDKEYIEWLSIIFMLLIRLEENKPNLLEQMIKNLYENPDTYIMAIIHTYDEKTCLLSDRGFSTPIEEKDHMAFSFNLKSNAFITYIFSDINKLASPNTPEALIKSFKSMPKSLHASHFHNDFNALEKYNRHVVYQCFNTVFGSSTDYHGIQIC